MAGDVDVRVLVAGVLSWEPMSLFDVAHACFGVGGLSSVRFGWVLMAVLELVADDEALLHRLPDGRLGVSSVPVVDVARVLEMVR